MEEGSWELKKTVWHVTGGDAEEDRPVCQHRSVLIISYSVLQICYCVSCPFDKKSPAVNTHTERESFSVRKLPAGFCKSYSKGYLILKGNLCQQVCVEPPPSALSVMLLFAAECRRLRHTCSYWSISPACSCSAANAPADVTAVNRTDRRMHDSYIDSAPYYAGCVNNWHTFHWPHGAQPTALEHWRKQEVHHQCHKTCLKLWLLLIFCFARCFLVQMHPDDVDDVTGGLILDVRAMLSRLCY